jgi:hypothetical protein
VRGYLGDQSVDLTASNKQGLRALAAQDRFSVASELLCYIEVSKYLDVLKDYVFLDKEFSPLSWLDQFEVLLLASCKMSQFESSYWNH